MASGEISESIDDKANYWSTLMSDLSKELHKIMTIVKQQVEIKKQSYKAKRKGQ